MFKSIVFGYDASEDSEHALAYALEIARREGARLTIAHVEEDIVGKGGGPIRFDEEEVQTAIKERAEELSAEGVDTTVKLASTMVGGPAPVIARIAEEAGADLIVVGSRGHSAAVGVLLGSVAQRLPHLARQPVLVIPADAPTPASTADRAPAGATAVG